MSWRRRRTPEEAQQYGERRGYRVAEAELRLLLEKHPHETGQQLLERVRRGEHRIRRKSQRSEG